MLGSLRITAEDDETPDHAPRKAKRLPLLCRINVYELGTGDVIRTLVFDFNNPKKRKWLMRIQIWAFANFKSVELLRLSDDELLRELNNVCSPEPRSNVALSD